MKGLSFNLRTLFIATAILVGVIYAGWRFSKWHPTGYIHPGLFAFQSEIDDQGLLFTVTASTVPIQNIELELVTNLRGSRQEVLYATGKISFEPCQQKQIRVVRGTDQGLSLEPHETRPVVKLPAHLQGSSYKLRLYQNMSYEDRGQGTGNEVLEFLDDQKREYGIWLHVNY